MIQEKELKFDNHLNRGICSSVKSILISLCRAEGLVEVLADPRPVQHRPHAVVLKGALVRPSGREDFDSKLTENFLNFTSVPLVDSKL